MASAIVSASCAREVTPTHGHGPEDGHAPPSTTVGRAEPSGEAAAAAMAREEAAAERAGRALANWRTACGSGPLDACVDAARAACAISGERGPCRRAREADEHTARLAEAEQEVARERAEEQALVDGLIAECDRNVAASCRRLTQELGQDVRFLKRACELKDRESCLDLHLVELARAAAERRARQERLFDAVERARRAGAPKRRAGVAADAAALRGAVAVHTDCSAACARARSACRQRGGAAGTGADLEATCTTAHVACQLDCEAALNREGFCYSERPVKTSERGEVVACP